MKEKLEQLYAKEMSRTEFVRYSGGVLLTVIGVAGFMRALLHGSNASSSSAPARGGSVQDYGVSTYGRSRA
jgi:hypothetical protein